MNINRQFFGITKEGESVDCFTLSNTNGMEVSIINYGGIIRSLKVPDRNGISGDVVLGFDNLDQYLEAHPYFGAIVGRYANRIKNAQFLLNGETIYLSKNESGNHLHGGFKGYDKVVWEPTVIDLSNKKTLVLKYLSKDGEEGYPGNLNCMVSFSVVQDNELAINYTCTTDQATIVNLTHHDYFNLKDGGATNIFDHELTIYADHFTPMDKHHIPTGAIHSVKKTNVDFTKAVKLETQLQKTNLADGFNINYLLQKGDDKLTHAADLYDRDSGRLMEVWTTQPGLQLYTAAHLSGDIIGKNGIEYKAYHGVCLEGQYFPDSPNYPHFPSTILQPDMVYKEQYKLKFKIK